MEMSVLVALSRQMVLRRQMDVLANNIANTSTAGFKSEQMLFREYEVPTATGDTMSFVQDLAILRDYTEGHFSMTGKSLDLAIAGKGWFVIDTEDGPRYTRNGQFEMNADGEMVDAAGNRVMDANDDVIVFQPGDLTIEVSADGSVTAGGVLRGKIRMVEFENDHILSKQGDSYFKADEEPEDSKESRISQGMLEMSNVKPIVEITTMINVMRAYQSSQNVVEEEDDMQRDAIQKLVAET